MFNHTGFCYCYLLIKTTTYNSVHLVHLYITQFFQQRISPLWVSLVIVYWLKVFPSILQCDQYSGLPLCTIVHNDYVLFHWGLHQDPGITKSGVVMCSNPILLSLLPPCKLSFLTDRFKTFSRPTLTLKSISTMSRWYPCNCCT